MNNTTKQPIMSIKWSVMVLMLMVTSIIKAQTDNGMVTIKGGNFTPFYGGDSIHKVIKSFKMDVHPVTNADYLSFLKTHPKWQKSKAIKLFVDTNYLEQFKDDLHLADGIKSNSPATNISWFAAKEYCSCQGKRLPTIAEWEYVGMANKTKKDAHKTPGYNQFILSWYEKQNSFRNPIESTFKNYWGVWDMHGLVWEWTKDFNSIIVSTDPGGGGTGLSNKFVCGGASINSADPSDYAAFMRYAFRASLKAKYCIRNLGFRCAKSIK